MSDSFAAAALRLFGLAARRLGWRPGDFWAATPAELMTALVPPDAAAPFGRDDLTRLMEQDDAG
ncbi:MAG: phage tail assembly chaperone [Novosphingobium sp.]